MLWRHFQDLLLVLSHPILNGILHQILGASWQVVEKFVQLVVATAYLLPFGLLVA